MTDKQARGIRLSLDGQYDPSWIAEALAHAASFSLVGDEDAQASALAAAVATTIQARVAAYVADVRALEARNTARERDMAARDAVYELACHADCGPTIH